MNFDEECLKRERFCVIIYDLTQSQEALEDEWFCSEIFRRLEDLYSTGDDGERFRHFYSDILSTLTQRFPGSVSGNINVLGQNIAILREKYECLNQGRSIDEDTVHAVRDALRKLHDHVSIEIARIAYADKSGDDISGEAVIQNIQAKITSLQDEVKSDYQETKDKLESSQKEYITILGIFAAVVLAFTGGLAFSTSALNNISQSSIYRTVLVTLIIGLVLINALFGLFYYINTLVGKEKKILPLVISNVIITLMLGATVIAWHKGIVERRNIEIETELLTPVIVEKSQQ